MKFSDYMKDNQITLLVCFAGGLFFSVLLLAFGISLSEMALLWVCDQLCLKLGIGIDIESEVGCYTTVLLHFPKSNHLNV